MSLDANSYPYGAVCYITAVSGGTTWQSSGVIVGPHTVLTASHVLWDTSTQQTMTNVRVYPAYSSGGSPIQGAYQIHYNPLDGVGYTLTRSASEKDFGIIDFAADLTSYGQFDLGTSGSADAVHLTGYPATSKGIQIDKFGNVTIDRSYDVFDYGSVTAPGGTSGGPVWVNTGDASQPVPTVIGVVSTTLWATELTAADLDTIHAWQDSDSLLFTSSVTAPNSSSHLYGVYQIVPAAFYVHNEDGTFSFGQVQNGTVSFTKVGGYGADWQTVGSGDYLGGGHTDVLLHNTTNGALAIAEVNNGQATYTQLGGYGNEWQALASGQFDASGHQDALLHNTQTGALTLASISNGHANFTQIGGFGNDWTTGTGTDAGGQHLNPNGLTGDILNDGRTGVVLHNTTTGAVVVAEDVNGSAQFTQVGAVGNEWQFLASGDFQGNGHTDLLLHNANTGALVLGEVANGQLSYATVSGFGNEWQAAGAGDYLGDGHTGVLLHNASTGAMVEGELVNGQMHYTQISALGNDWHLLA